MIEHTVYTRTPVWKMALQVVSSVVNFVAGGLDCVFAVQYFGASFGLGPVPALPSWLVGVAFLVTGLCLLRNAFRQFQE